MKKFEMLNIIFENCTLTAKEILVVQYFIYKSNKQGICYPAVSTIARECGVSKRTVQRATGKLQEKGYISINKRTVKGRQSSNEYRIMVESQDKPVIKCEAVVAVEIDIKEAASVADGTGLKEETAVNIGEMKVVSFESLIYGNEHEGNGEIMAIDYDNYLESNYDNSDCEKIVPVDTVRAAEESDLQAKYTVKAPEEKEICHMVPALMEWVIMNYYADVIRRILLYLVCCRLWDAKLWNGSVAIGSIWLKLHSGYTMVYIIQERYEHRAFAPFLRGATLTPKLYDKGFRYGKEGYINIA